MKKIGAFIFICTVMAFMAWTFSVGQPVPASVPARQPLAVTSTAAAFTPTSLPTEFLTAVPTLRPTATPIPTATLVPTGTAAPRVSVVQPTPVALPPLGDGDTKSDEPGSTDPIMRIQIPALGIDSVVVRAPYVNGDWVISGLGTQVGWLENTSLPELGGNTVLVGHLTMAGGNPGPFVQLELLEPGMPVVVTSGELTYHYRVIQQMVTASNAISALADTNLPRLTLITCYPPSWNGNARLYLQRQVVVAELINISQ